MVTTSASYDCKPLNLMLAVKKTWCLNFTPIGLFVPSEPKKYQILL
jgi:hypothetical protein